MGKKGDIRRKRRDVKKGKFLFRSSSIEKMCILSNLEFATKECMIGLFIFSLDLHFLASPSPAVHN